MAQCGMQRVLPVKEALNEGKCSRPKPFSRNPAAACLLAAEQVKDQGRSNDGSETSRL